jgi:CHASE3 domain sensor protein
MNIYTKNILYFILGLVLVIIIVLGTAHLLDQIAHNSNYGANSQH